MPAALTTTDYTCSPNVGKTLGFPICLNYRSDTGYHMFIEHTVLHQDKLRQLNNDITLHSVYKKQLYYLKHTHFPF